MNHEKARELMSVLFDRLCNYEEFTDNQFKSELSTILRVSTDLPTYEDLEKDNRKIQSYVKVATGSNNLGLHRIDQILREWDGIWYTYEKLLEELKKYNLYFTQKRAKEHLQKLVECGLVIYGPLWNSDGIPHGSGYTHISGEYEV